jgi:hypothetical protein
MRSRVDAACEPRGDSETGLAEIAPVFGEADAHRRDALRAPIMARAGSPNTAGLPRTARSGGKLRLKLKQVDRETLSRRSFSPAGLIRTF